MRYDPLQGRAFFVCVLAASAVVLGAALAAQYWGRLAPCELCLTERYPWDAAIVIAFVAAMVGDRAGVRWVAALLAAVFAVGSGLAFYHVGVEQHWFPGPGACTAPAGTADTLAALKAQILRQQPVRCDEPAWTLYGVSLAGWNLLASLVMSGFCLAAFARSRQARRRAPSGRRTA